MQTETKRKFIKFIGFIGVISVLSAGASGYFFQWRMKQVLRQYALMIKSQGLMLSQSGAHLKELGAAISSYAQTEKDLQSASSQQPRLQKVADEVRQQGQELSRYGGQLIRDIQAQEPEEALTTIADMRPLVSENLDRIKEQDKKIQDLEISAMKLTSRIQELRFRLSNCMSQPRVSRPYRSDAFQKESPSGGVVPIAKTIPEQQSKNLVATLARPSGAVADIGNPR